MHVGRIPNATRVLGDGQDEYHSLPVRDEILPCPAPLGLVRAMRSSWQPTPAEIEAIVAGAPIHLVVLGTAHPPVMLEVGDIPE